MTEPLLQAIGLRVQFGNRTVVDAIDFELAAAGALGLVGESGSGKSQTARAVLGLSPRGATLGGRILFEGEDLLSQPEAARRRWRGSRIAAVFQNPSASLTPHLRIGSQIGEVLEVHRRLTRAQSRAESLRLLDAVRLGDASRRLRQFPHELSGGQCQRVAIALALAAQPRLLVADEPTTALDATTQAQLLDLLRALRRDFGLALLLISHDLGVVAELCDDLAVLQAGRLVERGPLVRILDDARHPYTRVLLAAADPRRR
ncbi:ABC transporter ATP-binding protein [Fontimonas sp. SYSU GA230001]|uniref:ABC transporter ATP-binding protein n=1 Tax=Fontimonas sp. SYSU GA230001 TaxID=3142450 RepID=UPI0032B615A8